MAMTTLKELENRSVEVWNGMVEVWTQVRKQERIWTEKLHLEEKNNKYSCKNGVVSFVHNKRLFVIPEIPGVIDVLKSEGFEKANFIVPFSTGSYPVPRKKEWYALLSERDQS